MGGQLLGPQLAPTSLVKNSLVDIWHCPFYLHRVPFSFEKFLHFPMEITSLESLARVALSKPFGGKMHLLGALQVGIAEGKIPPGVLKLVFGDAVVCNWCGILSYHTIECNRDRAVRICHWCRSAGSDSFPCEF